MDKTGYLSVHLFYNDPLEDFLTKVLLPYAKSIIDAGIAEYYFFVRYPERGNHIRLRFRGEKTVLETLLKPNIKEYFENYFEVRPSTRLEPSYHPDTPEIHRWLPNNTVIFAEYEDQSARFGGSVGLEYAEFQFYSSSNIILNCIKNVDSENWSSEAAFGLAIKLHLCFAYALGFSLDEAIVFFSQCSRHWLPATFKLNRDRLTPEQFYQYEKVMLETFKTTFDEQKDTLIPFHQELWEQLQNDEIFEEDELINTWIANNMLLSKKLEQAYDEGLLNERPANFSLRYSIPLSAKKRFLWSLYSDFIHLSNNRLGISHKEESFISYIIFKSLEEVKKGAESSVGMYQTQP